MSLRLSSFLVAVVVASAATVAAAACSASPIGSCADPTALPLTASAGDPTDAGTLAPPGVPIYNPAFQGYTTWQTFHYASSIDAGPHKNGALTAWINQVPPHGSTEFPPGTIIIKRIESIPQTFAMEKRGGSEINTDGAQGWEFFELQTDCDGKTVSYLWRGFGPPMGEAYGGDPNACNGCHVGFQSNDYVGSQPLQLGNF